MNRNQFPPGRDDDRVKKLLGHYESQSEDDAIAEDNAAYESTTHTMMSVPIDMAPQIRAMIESYLQQ